ncbi:MAG: hypothetical protein ACRC9Y_10785 [Aeromonas veronii]
MYYLTAKDKDGFDEYLYESNVEMNQDEQFGRIYAYVSEEHARVGMAFLKAKIHALLNTPIYESKPIAFGLLRKDVLIPMSPERILELRRIKDTMKVSRLGNQFYNLRGVKL